MRVRGGSIAAQEVLLQTSEEPLRDRSAAAANQQTAGGGSAGRPAEAQIDAGGGDAAEPQLLFILFLSSAQSGEEPRGAGRRAAGFYSEKRAPAEENMLLLVLGVAMATAGSGVSAARVVSGELLTDLPTLQARTAQWR